MATSSAGGGPVVAPDGSELAKDATVDRTADAAEALAGAVDGDAVRVVDTTVQTFTAAPATGQEATAVYLVGAGPPVLDRNGIPRIAVVDPASSVIESNTGYTASQVEEINAKTPDLEGGRVPVAISSLPLPAGASTEATAQAIEDAVDGLEGGQAAGNASLANIDANTDQVEAKLGTLAAQETTTAKDASVDGLEALATTGNATLDAILVALDEALGPYARTTFGQIRVAVRETQFDNVQEYGLDTRAWGTQTANGGTVTFNTTTGMTDLTVTNASGSTAKLRTNTHFIYQPGAVTRIILTAVHSSAGETNQVRRWGFFNDGDGIAFDLVGTSLSLVRRTSTSGSPVDLPLPLASWDVPGNAPTLTNGNRFEIDLQWLSFGSVRVWVNGRPLHTFNFSDSIALPYTRTAQLPISLEIFNTGASTAATLSYVCSTVYLDGGTPLRFVPRERALSAPKTGIGTTYTPLIGLRMRDTVLGRTNRKIVIPTTSRVANASGRATVAVFLNPTSTTGGTWTAADAASGVEYNEGITAFTGGTELTRIFLPNTADSRELDGESSFALNGLHLRRDAFNTTGDLVLFAGKADVGTADIDIVARWKELG